MTMEAGEAWSASDVLARALRGPVKRRTPPRLRVFFLRQLRLCGEVSLAAKRTGVPLSTVYRWRSRDKAFRARWDEILLQRRQIVEDAGRHPPVVDGAQMLDQARVVHAQQDVVVVRCCIANLVASRP